MTSVEQVKQLITEVYGLTVTGERALQPGIQISTKEGPRVNVFETGRLQVVGSRSELLADLDERVEPEPEVAAPTIEPEPAAQPEEPPVFTPASTNSHEAAALTDGPGGSGLVEKVRQLLGKSPLVVVFEGDDDRRHSDEATGDEHTDKPRHVALEFGVNLKGLGRRKLGFRIQWRITH
jgi:hypothetical protein